MSSPANILYQSFVKPFYKENAGGFVFVFTMMFFIVSKVDGAGPYEYHYSLATGLLKNDVFLLSVFFVWLLYVRKCSVFVSRVVLSPQYSFLHIFNQLSKTKRIQLLLIVEFWLLMPVLLYALFISFVGFKQHLYLPVLAVVGYLLLLCFISAKWHVFVLSNPVKETLFTFQKLTRVLALPAYYPLILMRFVAVGQKMIWTAVKVFTCGLLYLTAANNTIIDYEVSMAFLFFNFGVLANAILIFRVREFEERYLNFYRGLPVSLTKRFSQYALMYAVFSIPEFITAVMLTPVHLRYTDAINFVASGYSLQLLMCSLTFLEDFKMNEYIKVLLLVFCVQIIFIMTMGFVLLYSLFFTLAIILFLKSYYNFERKIQ